MGEQALPRTRRRERTLGRHGRVPTGRLETMKKRIPESWLSAYVDGELDARRSAIVARLAARHPAIERRIDELRRVSAAVSSLPKLKLAGDARTRRWSTVLEHPA